MSYKFYLLSSSSGFDEDDSTGETTSAEIAAGVSGGGISDSVHCSTKFINAHSDSLRVIGPELILPPVPDQKESAISSTGKTLFIALDWIGFDEK